MTPNQHTISHRGYFLLKDITWRPSIIASIIRCINLPASSISKNMVYIPNSRRTMTQLVEMLALYIVHLDHWQCMLGLRRPVGDPSMMLGDLQEACGLQLNSLQPKVFAKELLRYWEGLPLTSSVLADFSAEVEGQPSQSDKKRKKDQSSSQTQESEGRAGQLTQQGQKELLKQSKPQKPKKQKIADPEGDVEIVSQPAPPKPPRKKAPTSTTTTSREQIASDRALAEQMERDQINKGKQTTLTQLMSEPPAASSSSSASSGTTKEKTTPAPTVEKPGSTGGGDHSDKDGGGGGDMTMDDLPEI